MASLDLTPPARPSMTVPPIAPTRHAVSIDEETLHLMELYGGDHVAILNLIAGHFTILATRSQVLLQLAGITISITGASGANIAKAGHLPAVLLISGMTTILFAASIVMIGILRVKWNSSLPPCSPEVAIKAALTMRDAKTRAYSGALALLVAGLTLYLAAIGTVVMRNVP